MAPAIPNEERTSSVGTESPKPTGPSVDAVASIEKGEEEGICLWLTDDVEAGELFEELEGDSIRWSEGWNDEGDNGGAGSVVVLKEQL